MDEVPLLIADSVKEISGVLTCDAGPANNMKEKYHLVCSNLALSLSEKDKK